MSFRSSVSFLNSCTQTYHQMFGFLIIMIIIYPQSRSSSLNESGGVRNFKEYYQCYFNKYFDIPNNEKNSKRDTFVSELLKEALASNDKAPTNACVDWICDSNLRWKIWDSGLLEIWAYYTETHNVISSWQDCFQDRYKDFEEENFRRNPTGKITVFPESKMLSQRFSHAKDVSHRRNPLACHNIWVVKEPSLLCSKCGLPQQGRKIGDEGRRYLGQ